MPDDWEISQGLNPNDSTDKNSVRTDGYTQIETYINSLTGESINEVAENRNISPVTFDLHSNYPNPFNPTTTIEYNLVKSGFVSLKVFGLQGKEITTLVNGFNTAGMHRVIFNARTVATGVYFVQFQVGAQSKTIKLIMIK